jgi:hypothetical protein
MGASGEKYVHVLRAIQSAGALQGESETTMNDIQNIPAIPPVRAEIDIGGEKRTELMAAAKSFESCLCWPRW